MEKLFYPEAVVVIGVSENPENLARCIVGNLFEFQFRGEIFLIGKKEGILFGRRILTSFDQLPEGIDVAVILTPAPTVPAILEACGRKRIPWAVIETGGFREYSEEGAKLEEKTLEAARRWGIRIVGPNGIGIFNMENGFVVPFVSLKHGAMRKGKLSILAQSGGVSFSYFNLLSSANVGVSKMVSMGNKLDLNEIDFLRYLIKDPETEMIGLYLESLERGRELMELARSTSKPILVHKANTAESSREIARLHTAALANDDRIVDAALRQVDIVRVTDFRTFVNTVKILSLPAMKGNNLVVVSRSGGMAIVAADGAAAHEFRLCPLAESFRKQVHQYFRAKVIRPTNPLDLGDLFDFDLYTKILEEVLKIEGVDGVLFQHGAIAEEKEPSRRLITAMKELSFRYQKPVALCYITDEEETAYIKKTIDYPIFAEPLDALAALAVSRDHHLRKACQREKPPLYPVDRDRVGKIIERVTREKRNLSLTEALGVIEAYGLPVAPYRVVDRKEDLKRAMDEIRRPLVLKTASPDIVHKSDVGGVILHIETLAQAEKAYERLISLSGNRGSGVLAQAMVAEGKEVILGAKRDPSFGPVVLFGLGGIYVEILADTSLRVAPITRAEAHGMISELKGSKILKGVRGEKPLDVEALVDSLLRLSQLVTDFPEIEGIDINPVKVLEKGAVALDCRITLPSSSSLFFTSPGFGR